MSDLVHRLISFCDVLPVLSVAGIFLSSKTANHRSVTSCFVFFIRVLATLTAASAVPLPLGWWGDDVWWFIFQASMNSRNCWHQYWGGVHESSLPVAHPGYQVLSDILFRLGLIANCSHTVQYLDCSDLNWRCNHYHPFWHCMTLLVLMCG